MRKRIFNFFFILDLEPCNHTMSIKRRVSIYFNDHEKIKDWSPRCYNLAATACCCTQPCVVDHKKIKNQSPRCRSLVVMACCCMQPCVVVYCCLLLQAATTLLHVAGLCNVDCCPFSELLPQAAIDASMDMLLPLQMCWWWCSHDRKLLMLCSCHTRGLARAALL